MAYTMTDFVYMTLPDMNGEGFQYVPDEPGAVQFQEARGWQRSKAPVDPPLTPVSSPEQDWITLYHPKLGVAHEFPNNDAAIAGANAVGWFVAPESKSEPQEETPESEPEPKPKRSAKAKDDKGVTDNG
jgi:hypothetical protein